MQSKTFNSSIWILLGALLIGLWWRHSGTGSSTSREDRVRDQKEIQSGTPEQTAISEEPNAQSTSPQGNVKSAATGVSAQAKNFNPESFPEEVLSPESAGERAFATGDIATQMFELESLPPKKAPPSANEAKVFRGLIRDRSDHERYIELRFEGEKWHVLVGTKKDELTDWGANDVIPFRDNKTIWTVYFEKSEGLFLQHFPKVNIPELNGNFEVLSGWLTTPIYLTHMALIGIHDAWPPEARLVELMPRRPRP